MRCASTCLVFCALSVWASTLWCDDGGARDKVQVDKHDALMHLAEELVAEDEEVQRWVREYHGKVRDWGEKNNDTLLTPTTEDPEIACKSISFADPERDEATRMSFMWVRCELEVSPTADTNYVIGAISFVRLTTETLSPRQSWDGRALYPRIADRPPGGEPQVVKFRTQGAPHAGFESRQTIVVFVYNPVSDTIIVLDAAEAKPISVAPMPK